MKTLPESAAGLQKLREFLASDERVFAWPTGHPSQSTGFCPCDWPAWRRGGFYLRATLLLAALRWPFNGLKLRVLRRFGARVGRQVYLASNVWIDPVFVSLLTIEDQVLVGEGVRIALHEFGRNQFRAGRVILRRGALIGGFALLGHGIEIGENAVVAGGAVVGRDVPPGMMAVGNPARNYPLAHEELSELEPSKEARAG